MKKIKKRLGDLLLEHNMITQTQLEEALQAQAIYGGKLGTNLVELGYISEASLTEFLSQQLSIPSTKPDDFTNIPSEIINLIPKEFAKEHKLIPLKKTGKRLHIAVVDPFDMTAIDELAFKTSMIIDIAIAPEILIVYALETYYGITREARYIKLSGVTSEEIRLTDSLADGIQTAPTISDKPKAHPYPLQKLSEDLARIESKEEIFNILLKYFEFYFEKLATFIVRYNILQGFVAQGFKITKDEFRRLEVTLDAPSVFKDAIDKQTIFAGKIPKNGAHSTVLSALNITEDNRAYIIPLLLNNQTISLLLCYSFKDLGPKDLPLKDFDIVSKKISYAFQILFLKKRILST